MRVEVGMQVEVDNPVGVDILAVDDIQVEHYMKVVVHYIQVVGIPYLQGIVEQHVLHLIPAVVGMMVGLH
jgi:hypothetical protein